MNVISSEYATGIWNSGSNRFGSSVLLTYFLEIQQQVPAKELLIFHHIRRRIYVRYLLKSLLFLINLFKKR